MRQEALGGKRLLSEAPGRRHPRPRNVRRASSVRLPLSGDSNNYLATASEVSEVKRHLVAGTSLVTGKIDVNALRTVEVRQVAPVALRGTGNPARGIV